MLSLVILEDNGVEFTCRWETSESYGFSVTIPFAVNTVEPEFKIPTECKYLPRQLVIRGNVLGESCIKPLLERLMSS